MNEVIQRLIEKTGLPEDKAALAVNIVMDFLKERLPAPIASQLDSALGEGGMMGSLGGMGSTLGGLFGKKE